MEGAVRRGRKDSLAMLRSSRSPPRPPREGEGGGEAITALLTVEEEPESIRVEVRNQESRRDFDSMVRRGVGVVL